MPTNDDIDRLRAVVSKERALRRQAENRERILLRQVEEAGDRLDTLVGNIFDIADRKSIK